MGTHSMKTLWKLQSDLFIHLTLTIIVYPQGL